MVRHLALLLVAGSCLAQPAGEKPLEDRRFDSALVREVYRIQPMGREFSLGQSAVTPIVVPSSSMTGEKKAALRQLPCSYRSGYRFQVGPNASETDGILAGRCKGGQVIRATARELKDMLSSDLAMLNLPADKAREAGLYYSEEKLPDGSEFIYFPFVAVGHGIGFALNGARIDKAGNAIVVQTSNLGLCQQFKESQFCKDPRAALRQIAQALAASPTGK